MKLSSSIYSSKNLEISSNVFNIQDAYPDLDIQMNKLHIHNQQYIISNWVKCQNEFSLFCSVENVCS